MKTRKLRLLSALLAVAMMLALLPTAAFAADGELPTSGTCGAKGNEDNVHWTLESDGTMTISGSGAMAGYASANGQPWTGQRDNIKNLVVEDGVTSIGNNAFRDYTALKNVDLSKALSLKTIDTSFWGCEGLQSVELNEGLKEIGGSAFSYCTSLKSIHIPSTVENIGGWCFQDCYGLEEVTFAKDSKLTTIQGATFIRCHSLKKITIPKSVKLIEKEGYSHGAFSGCSALKSVTFEPGSQLETVDSGAFDSWRITFYYSDKDANVKTALTNGNVAAGKIKPLTPTVTFNVEGKEFEKQNAKDNNFKAAKPENPTKKGYNFAGWYTKNADGNWAEKPFNFDTTITEDITLYARWRELGTYGLTVTDGTAWVNGKQVTEAAEGDEVTIKADETALEGMTFERWEVRKGEVKLADDRAAETSFTMPAGEVQLEAMYQAADVHDSGWDAATVVTGAVIGTGTAILAYHIGLEVYAEQVLGKDVAVPRTRGEVALLAWQLAGSPAVNGEGEPLSEAAQAEKWAVESGLMQPAKDGSFAPEKKMSKWKALRVLDAAKKMG